MSMDGCPGARVVQFEAAKGTASAAASGAVDVPSQLRQWPVQLHLVPPTAPYYRGADVLLTADCVAYAMGGFHARYLRGSAIAIACPKLDEGQEAYAEKVRAMIDEGGISTLTVLIMQVPCCGGLLAMARQAASLASRKVPMRSIVVSLQGEVLREEWIEA